jgi:uncharacterized protein with HEPN domain
VSDDIIWTIIHESIPSLKREVELLLGEVSWG